MASDREKANAGRVHITYDIETNGVKKKEELPFVIGVIGDFAGKTKQDKVLAAREFEEVKSVDALMAGMKPSLSYRVTDPDDDSKQIPVDLTFKKLADFSPNRVAEQVEPIARLKALRNKLEELLNRNSTDVSRDLSKLIEAAMKDEHVMSAAKSEMALEGRKTDDGAGK